MERVTLEQWKAAAETHTHLPFALRVEGVVPPTAWQPHLGPDSLLLESARDGNYTIYVPQVLERLIFPTGEGEPVLARLREYFARHNAPRFSGLPPFTGGLVGCFSYDMARQIERLPSTAQDDLGLPVAAFAVADELLVFDLRAGALFVIVVAETAGSEPLDERYAKTRTRAEALLSHWQQANAGRVENCAKRDDVAASDSPAAKPHRELSLDRDSYTAAVRRTQQYIAAGDTYQVNLSVREARELSAYPARIYETLRRINPSPYMAYLPFPEWTLVCGSPELLVRSLDGKVEARPIAGTRPRGACADSDAALSGELLAHPKERAEHLMLVDLIRNDLGRVCRYGSIEVTDFMVLEGYSHVQHIVSHIVGDLDAGHDRFDLIASCFPGGTITGAPKVRTMEIIEELEPVRRGFYTGSVGWMGYNGDVELNIVIRTMLAKDGLAYVQAGAGVVADSVPEKEYEESLNKARALWVALEEAAAHADLSR